MKKLLQKGTLVYILQCQEMELLTCEGDMDKHSDTRVDSKTSQGVSRASHGASTKPKH